MSKHDKSEELVASGAEAEGAAEEAAASASGRPEDVSAVAFVQAVGDHRAIVETATKLLSQGDKPALIDFAREALGIDLSEAGATELVERFAADREFWGSGGFC